MYPLELCERPIKAVCPKKVCAECGESYSRETEVEYEEAYGEVRNRNEGGENNGLSGTGRKMAKYIFGPLKKQRDCNTGEWKKGVVLDPFAGAGTTLLAVRQHNRDYIGIELNPEYAEIAEYRIRDQVGGEPLDQFMGS